MYGRIIRGFVTWCYDEELFRRNWKKKIILPKLHRKVKPLVSERTAFEIIIAGTTPSSFENGHTKAAKSEHQDALKMLLFSGIRVGEAKKILIADLELDAETPYFVIHSKGGNTERQVVPEAMLEILRRRRKQRKLDDSVFDFTEKTANKLLKRGCKKLGITIIVKCHTLRDIYSKTRLDNGRLYDIVSKTLRHTNPNTLVKFYADYNLADLAEVVNDSTLTRDKMPMEERFKRLLKLIEKMGLDIGIKLDTEVSEKGFSIRGKRG